MEKYLLPENDGLPVREFGKWTKDKLFYLERYISMFEKSMRQKKWCARCYIDLFSGKGKYKIENQREVNLGSPLLALTTEYPFTHYFFVDYVEENISTLEKRSSALPDIPKKFYVGNANQKVDEIVDEIKSIERNRPQDTWTSLNLAFLDPDGLELEWKTVAKLAQIRKMDLIIHYSQSGLTRNFENYVHSGEETILDRFFGDTEWRKVYEKYRLKEPSSVNKHLIDYYKSKLIALGYEDIKDVEDYESAEPIMRNTRQAPLYRLIFASKHKRGHDFWKEVIRKNVAGQTSFW